jgi:hypothetical protein
MMCTTTIRTLDLAALLSDPLIQLVMRSDNVSASDHSALLLRMQEAIVARDYGVPSGAVPSGAALAAAL